MGRMACKPVTSRTRFSVLMHCLVSQSFATGRAPSIHLSNTDTKFPDEENDSGISGCKCYAQIGPAGA